MVKLFALEAIVIFASILGVAATPPSSPAPVNDGCAIIDRIEGDYAVVEFSKGEALNTLDIPAEDISGEVSEGMEIPVLSAEGKFYGDIICMDTNGVGNICYQFETDDNSYWVLSYKEIGHTPSTKDTYTLYYIDNGTELQNDDIFLHIERNGDNQ